MKPGIRLLLLPCLLLMGLGISCDSPSSVSPLLLPFEGKWQLFYMPGYSQPFEVMFAEKKPVLIFNAAEGTYRGDVICNSITGRFEIPDSAHIRFSDPIGTSYPCKGFAEPSFIDALKVTEFYQWHSPDTLWLYRKNLLVMKLIRQPDSP